MHWLTESVQHVIGGVNHVADAALSDTFESGTQPVGTGTDPHAGDHGGDVARTADGIVDPHRRVRASGAEWRAVHRHVQRRRRNVRRTRRHRHAEHRSDFARHAHVRQQVGTIRQHIEIQACIRNREHVEQRRAGRCLGVERKNAVMLLTESELTRRAQHPVARLSTDLALLDLESARHDRARTRERVLGADHHIWRATHHLEQRTTTVIDLGDPEVIGVGMASRFDHLRDHERGEFRTEALDVVERDTVTTQRIADLLRGAGVRYELLEPLMRNDHRANCSRKRTSES